MEKRYFDASSMKIALCPDCKGKGFDYNEFGTKIKCYHCDGFGRVVREKEPNDLQLSEFDDFDGEDGSQLKIEIEPQEEADECPSA